VLVSFNGTGKASSLRKPPNWFSCSHKDSVLIDLFLVFNATFSNISAISWRTVLVVEEAGVPGENHRSRASNW
jgi:hypothetical protein